MNTTTLLKKSIEFEQGKVLNLLNHTPHHLIVMIEIMDSEKAAIEHTIKSNQYYLDSAEDMAEGLRSKLETSNADENKRLETLIAWRNLFWSAYDQVK